MIPEHITTRFPRHAARLAALLALVMAAAAPQAPAGMVAGRIGGAFDTTAHGGAAYAIPIQVAAGVNDLKPGIALSYNSQSGEGVAGPGWSLAGFSEITRCNQTRALYGRAVGVRFTRQDRLCLDGQPLVHVAGVLAGDGSEYRSEVHQFERIIAHGQQGSGPAWFELRHPDGTVYRYGNDADSRIEAAGSTEVRAWALNEIVDRFQQRIGFAYAEDAVGGEYVPAEVRWTYASEAAFEQARYRLLFSWELKPPAEVREGFVWGMPWKLSQRLRAIEYQHDRGSGFARVHRYALSYVEGDANLAYRSHLESIVQCGPTQCLPPTVFAWDEGTFDRTVSTTVGPPGTKSLFGDYNGDGAADLFGNDGGHWAVWPADPQNGGFLAPIAIGGTVVDSSFAKIIDYDGDGRSDLLTGSDQGPNWLVYVSHSTMFSVKNTGVPWSTTSEPDELAVLDMDADGLDDVAYLRDAVLYYRRNTGSAFAPEKSAGIGPVPAGLDPAGGNLGDLEPADFDGDGRRDLLVRRTNPPNTMTITWEAFLSTGLGFGPEPIGTVTAGPNRSIVVLDINGDGLSDVLARDRATLRWESWLSHGTGVMSAPGLVHVSCPDPLRYDESAPPIPVDWNGDGRSEVVNSQWDGGHHIYRSDGGCFSNADRRKLDIYSLPKVADVNGDGSPDLLSSRSSNRWTISTLARWARPDGSLALRPDLLREITDGLGNHQEINYRVLTGWPGYRSSGRGLVNTRLVRGAPLAVVSSYSSSTGVAGGHFSVGLEYADALVDSLGRGFLGFGSVRSTDSRTGLVTETVYRQDFPYIGHVERTIVWNGVTRISEQDPTWMARAQAVPDVAADMHFVYLASEVNDAWEVDEDGGLAGTLVRHATRKLTWNFDHGAVASEQLAVTSPLQSGVTFTTTRNATYDEGLRTGVGCLGYPTRIDVVREASGAAAQTRSMSAVYDPGTCRPTTRTEGPVDDPAQQLLTLYVYDAQGRVQLEARTDGAGQVAARRTRYAYGPTSSRPTSEARIIADEPDFAVSHAWNEALGLETSRTEPQGTRTSWRHDEFGRITAELRPSGSTATSYSACGPCIAPGARYAVLQQRSDGYWSETQHDSLGRTVGRAFVLPDDKVSRQLIEYDSLGRVSRESAPYLEGATHAYWTSYAYDLLGRPKRVDRPLGVDAPTGGVSTLVYSGTSVTTRDALGRTTVQVHDAEGRLTSVQPPLNGGATYAYDAAGQLVSLTDASGHARQLGYDARGQLTQVSDPDAGQRTFTYDVFGELVRQSDGKSPANVVTWQYDQLGRVRSRTEPEGTTTWTWSTATGGSRGLLQGVVGPGESGPTGFNESYAYDALSRLQRATTVIDGSSYVTDYAYDAEGKLTAMTYPQTIGWRPKFFFGYRNGHLTTIDQEALAVTPVYKLLSLDARAREAAVRYGGGALEERNDYDAASGHLTAIRSGPATSPAAVQNYAYEWDAIGNLLARQDLGATPQLVERFAYDELNRLSRVTLNGVQTLAMSYRPDGNLLTKSDVGNYGYGNGSASPHAVTAVGGGVRGLLTYEYDANGNMTRRGGSALTWTSFNLPRQVNEGADYARFSYGPGRDRVRQDAKAGSRSRTIHYVGPHFEVEIEGAVRRYRANVFAYGRAVFSQVETTPGGLEAYYVLHDHGGSVDRLVRAAGAGADGLALSFDAWGKRRNTNWSADPADQRFGDTHWSERGYTGHEHLDNVRLVHMNGRLEDPILGRMISPDPMLGSLADPQALNPYSYVANNPASYYDPSGYFLSKLRSFFKRAIRHVASFGQRVTRRWGRSIAAMTAAYFTAGGVSSWASSIGAPSVSVSFGAPASALLDSGLAAGTLTATVPSAALLGGAAGEAIAGAISPGTSAGIAAGAISGGALAGIGSLYGNTYSVVRVLAEASVSGASAAAQGGNFADGFVVGGSVSSLTWASLEMRRAMVAQSRLRRKDGGDNAQGVSDGFRGDVFKLGGCRWPCKESPLGGIQNEAGNVFGVGYGPGSFLDRLVETYAGPHDYLNSGLFYNSLGNNVSRPKFFEIFNAANVAVATPFAAASVVPVYTYGVLGD